MRQRRRAIRVLLINLAAADLKFVISLRAHCDLVFPVVSLATPAASSLWLLIAPRALSGAANVRIVVIGFKRTVSRVMLRMVRFAL